MILFIDALHFVVPVPLLAKTRTFQVSMLDMGGWKYCITYASLSDKVSDLSFPSTTARVVVATDLCHARSQAIALAQGQKLRCVHVGMVILTAPSASVTQV